MAARIQMSRTRPWRAEHPDAVIVDRRTRWGNPYRVVQSWRGGATGGYVYRVRPEPSVAHFRQVYGTEREAAERAVALYRFNIEERIEFGSIWLDDLRGRDLACWCPLDQPCHADVLLELANAAVA